MKINTNTQTNQSSTKENDKIRKEIDAIQLTQEDEERLDRIFESRFGTRISGTFFGNNFFNDKA